MLLGCRRYGSEHLVHVPMCVLHCNTRRIKKFETNKIKKRNTKGDGKSKGDDICWVGESQTRKRSLAQYFQKTETHTLDVMPDTLHSSTTLRQIFQHCRHSYWNHNMYTTWIQHVQDTREQAHQKPGEKVWESGGCFWKTRKKGRKKKQKVFLCVVRLVRVLFVQCKFYVVELCFFFSLSILLLLNFEHCGVWDKHRNMQNKEGAMEKGEVVWYVLFVEGKVGVWWLHHSARMCTLNSVLPLCKWWKQRWQIPTGLKTGIPKIKMGIFY